MKYIIFSYFGYGLSIAYHLQQEGHEVIVGRVEQTTKILTPIEGKQAEYPLERKSRLKLYTNMLKIMSADVLVEKMKRIPNPQDYFVFFELNNLYRYAEKIKDMGFHGNFPTLEDRLLEVDRDAAKDFVKKYYPKISIAEKKEFAKVSEGLKFLDKTDDIWVIKGNDESAKTFVPDTDDPVVASKQTMEQLESYKALYEKSGYMLELFIPWMMEVTPQKTYYNGKPIGITIDIENKPIGSGNLSVQTLCAADLVFPVNMDDRISQIAFPPIVDEMAKKHPGLFIWDASLLINKRTGKIYFGEFCANRFGYNAFYTELAQAGSVNQYFESLVNYENPVPPGTVGTSTTIFSMQRDPVYDMLLKDLNIDFKPEIEKNLWLYDVYRKGDKYLSAGYDYNVATITGAGSSIQEAVQRLFKNIEGFSYVGAYYRPKADYVSLDYPSSILNRLNYGMERGLYQLKFNVKVGVRPT